MLNGLGGPLNRFTTQAWRRGRQDEGAGNQVGDDVDGVKDQHVGDRLRRLDPIRTRDGEACGFEDSEACGRCRDQERKAHRDRQEHAAQGGQS